MKLPRLTPTSRRIALSMVGALVGGVALTVPLTPTSAAAATDVTDGLVLSYDLTQGTGTTVSDTSGSGHDGTLVNGGSWDGTQGLKLDGVDDYVRLPNDLMSGLSAITVSVDVYVEAGQASPFFLWGLGNPATSNGGTGYLMASGNSLRAAVTTGNWSGEQVTQPSPSRNLARGVWKSVTYTQVGTTGTLYEDGARIASNSGVTVLPSRVGNGVTTANVLGESTYASDNSLQGRLRSFRVYDRALSADEVASISLTDATRVESDRAALDLGDLTAVTADLSLPTEGPFGSAISWSSSRPAIIATDGAVTRPNPGESAAQVTLTATITRGSVTQTRQFEATVVPQSNDQDKAAAAAAALTLVHADDVRGNLTLPTSGSSDATVTWASSAPGVVSATGVVHRPSAGSGSAGVTMTATVTVGSATATRAIDLTVREAPALAPYTGYAFSYFTGNSIAGEKIYFAASRGNNALQWDELNGGDPVLESTLGEKGLRDPFLIRSPEGDRFFLIATDLSIGRNGDWDRSQRTGSRYLEVWESTDLIHWSDQRHVLVSPPTAGNTWAPEAYWDDDLQAYVVFWASKLYDESDTAHTGTTYNRMLYATTRDFVTFTPAQIWQDRGESRIDSTVIKDGSTFYRFTKDEGGGGTGCSDIIQEKSSSLTAVDLPGDPAWTFMQGCIGARAGTSAVEGPTVFKANPNDSSANDYYLFVDEYGGRGYIPLGADDLEDATWTVPSAYNLPASPRHGTVIPVTQAELDALRADTPAPDPVTSDADGLVLRLPLTGDADDASGHGYDGTVVGDATFSDGALTLDGTNDYVRLPDNMMSGLQEITVSSKVWVDADQSGNYFLWNLGNTADDGTGDGYLFATGDSSYRAAIASGDWNTEQGMSSGSALGRGAWRTVTYTLDDSGTAVLYLDGVQVGRKTGVTIRPGDIGGGVTTANYIGRSAYTADKLLRGKVRDFRLYSRALTAGEVGDLADDGTGIRGVTLSSLKTSALIDADAGTVILPVQPGTDLTTLNPVYAVGTGSTVTPSGSRDYSAPVRVTVTAAGGASRTWTVTALPMRSPVLPGLYADPDIAEFGGTYYIYATTDGTAGWGGKDFYVWKSTDLVNWTRSSQPFLTLDGADGNVPWASGNAWAPTIIERDGRYYFYFSGHNPTYDRKTIGVAVADSPEGPFTAQSTAMILNNESVTSGQAIDPAAFRDPQTGRYYLFWGNGRPVYAELGDDMVSLKGGVSAITGLTDFREGSFVNYRNGTYYLTYSIDDTGSEDYRVGYATASSVTGPWTYRGVILQKDPSQGILATGHSSIIQVPGTDDWYIAYHRFAIPGGDGTHRETTIDKLEFNADGTIKPVVPTLTSIAPLARVGVRITSSDDISADGWFSSSVTVALTAPTSGQTIQYRINGGAWRTYRSTLSVSATGSTVIEHRLVASGAVVAGSSSQTVVKIDKGAPTVSATRQPTTKGTPRNPVTVLFTATDAVSGVASVEYRVNSGAWTTATGPVVFDTVGDRVIAYRSTDRAGNVSRAKSTTVVIAADPLTAVTPSKATVRRGAALTLRMTGFLRGDLLTVTIGSLPPMTTTADVNGAAAVSLTIPTSATVGPAAITVSSSDGALRAQSSVQIR